MPFKSQNERIRYRKEYYENHKSEEKSNSERRARANRQMLNQIKEERGCLICGTRDNLEFHHRDPSKKYKILSKMCNYSKERILEEVAKCDVMCAKCHNDLHRHSGRIIVIPIPIYIAVPYTKDPQVSTLSSVR